MNAPRPCFSFSFTDRLSHFFFCMLCIMLAVSCNRRVKDSKWENSFPPFSNQVVLKSGEQKVFSLDSVTTLKYEAFQYIDKNNILVSYNSFDNSLVCFNYSTGDLVKKISLSKISDSSRKHGPIDSYSFRVINFDSIYFYDQKKEIIYLFDSAVNLKRSYSVKSKENMIPHGRALPGQLLEITRNEIGIPGWPGRDAYNANAPLSNNLLTLIDKKTASIHSILKYPDIYRSALWGEYLHRFYAIYNEAINSWIISFPIAHDIFVIDDHGTLHQYDASSELIQYVTPLSFNKREKEFKDKQEVNNIRTQHIYSRVLYDEYNHLYYRIISSAIPPKDITIAQEGYRFPPFRVVTLNEQFKKIGEQDINSNEYFATSMFISKDGLCIPSAKSSDTKMLFSVFTPVLSN